MRCTDWMFAPRTGNRSGGVRGCPAGQRGSSEACADRVGHARRNAIESSDGGSPATAVDYRPDRLREVMTSRFIKDGSGASNLAIIESLKRRQGVFGRGPRHLPPRKLAADARQSPPSNRRRETGRLVFGQWVVRTVGVRACGPWGRRGSRAPSLARMLLSQVLKGAQ